MEKTLINIKQAGDYLGMKQSWIRMKVFHKELPHYKIGGHLRFRIEDLDQWIESRLVKTKSEIPNQTKN